MREHILLQRKADFEKFSRILIWTFSAQKYFFTQSLSPEQYLQQFRRENNIFKKDIYWLCF